MSPQEHASRPFAVFGVLVGLLGAGALFCSWVQLPPTHSAYLLLVALAAVAAEALAVALPGGGSASLSYPLSVAATVLLGPTGGGIVAGLSGINLDDIRRQRPLSVYMFNVGQVVLSSVLAGWAYIGLGGRILLGSTAPTFTASDFPALLPAIVALVSVALVLNAGLTVWAVSLLRAVRAWVVWRGSISWALPLQAVMGVLGAAIAQVVSITPVGFLLFVFPLIVARQLYQRYVGLKDAYLDTVRSLVAAIEAKDPYTRGHSERVAGYSVSIGGLLHLADAQVERLEFAALLHDLGKVGIRSSILGKAGALNTLEFEEIRSHPEIGARILERVPYLADIVPAVVAHHERFDGTGYGHGLRAHGVPLEARVLAVADSYDAMTTVRPYREALTHDQAVEELRLGAGTQFDPEIVRLFLGQEDVARPSSGAPDASVLPQSAEAVMGDG